MLPLEKKLTINRIPLIKKNSLAPRPSTGKVDYAQDMEYLSAEIINKSEWIVRCERVLRDWALVQGTDVQRENLMKQALILIDAQEYGVRLLAIKACLNGFMTMPILEILFGKTQKQVLRRPKSGSKQEQLPSVLSSPQQFLAVVQKCAGLSNDKGFVQLLNEIPLAQCMLKLLKLFSSIPKDPQSSGQLILYLPSILTTLKNCANNQKEQPRILQAVQILDDYLHTFPQDLNNQDITSIYVLITQTLRNLAIDATSTQVYLTNGIIHKLVKSMVTLSNSYDLTLNTLRIMSKMSSNKQCCQLFLESEEAMRNITGFFKVYQTDIHIIIRSSFLLANMTTHFEGIRQMIYYNQFPDLVQCFDYFWNKELNPSAKLPIDKLGQSYAAWDFKTISQEKDIDALIRIIRLIANLLTIEQIGLDIVSNPTVYKYLIQKIVKLLQKCNQIKTQSELISCGLSCLSNLTFYEKAAFVNDFEYKNLKFEVITLLGHFIIQNIDQEICCDGLRVLSNLSRQKDLIKQIIKTRVAEGVIVLLDSNSQDVVYYSLGVIVNLLQDTEFKMSNAQIIHELTLQVLADCTLEQNDIANISLKCLIMLLDAGLSAEQVKSIENAVTNYGTLCDQILKDRNVNSLQNTRILVNQIINNIPEECYNCIQPNCGRRFKTREELQIHISRRHKI